MRVVGTGLIFAILVTGITAIASSAAHSRSAHEESKGRAGYRAMCAGCHGMDGSSAPAKLPHLKGRVGVFLCAPEGREYILRLPNVANAPVTATQMADILNYMASAIGGDSRPPGAPLFEAREVVAGRKRSSMISNLSAERGRVALALTERCNVPADLLD